MEVAINNLIEGQAEKCAEIIVKYQKFTTRKILEKNIKFINPETHIQAVEVTCLGYRK